MSTPSSSFLSGYQPGDCRPHADIVVFYDGSTADLPTIEGGTLVFAGGRANVPSQGINLTGPGKAPFRMDYNAIHPGGAGVKIRCQTTDTRQRLRFNVTRPQGCNSPETNIVTLELCPLDTCTQAYEYDSELPLNLFRRCSTMETDCQIIEELARQFNQDYAHLGTAYSVVEVVGGNNVYALDIESKNPGEVFYVRTHEGLSSPRTIIPASKRTYTRQLVQDWFGTSPNAGNPIFTGADASLNAVELFADFQVGTSFSGVATSNLADDTTTYTPIKSVVTVLFESNTNADAAQAKLRSLLKGPASGNLAAPYLAKLVDDTCADVLLYPYTIVRADAGDDAARQAVISQYPDAKVVYQAGRIAGKSYYEVYTGADTIPAPTSAQAGDTVTKGNNQVPAPYTVSACPVGTPCADCPPVTPAPL